jgi:hypothetical protein
MNYLFFNFVLSFIFSLAQDLPYYVYINSVPKCGTHLAMKAIGLILGKPFGGNRNIDILHELKKIHDKNFIYAAHTSYTNISKVDNFFENKPRKDFLVIRDPRDFIVSFSYWIKKDQQRWPYWSSLEINKLINEWIHGLNFLTYELSFSTYDNYNFFYFDWLANNPKSFVIRFEDLIGSQGGGSDQKQIETLIRMMEYLEVEPTDKLLKHVQDNLFGSTGTFREGKIGAWKKEFSDEQKVLFHEKYSDLLNKLGYSID